MMNQLTQWNGNFYDLEKVTMNNFNIYQTKINDFVEWMKDYLFLTFDNELHLSNTYDSELGLKTYTTIHNNVELILKFNNELAETLNNSSYKDWKNVDEFGHPQKYNFGITYVNELIIEKVNFNALFETMDNVLSKLTEIKKEYGGI